MNTDTLRTFVTLSQCRNFTKTAQTLFLSQSTVSDRIRELENQLNQRLINREARTITLTSAGKAFLFYAEKILELEQQSITEIHMMEQYKGRLRIAAAHNLFDTHVSDILCQYADIHPEITLEINVAHSEEILPQINNCDIAFTYMPLQSSAYICKPFIEENIILVTNSENTEYKNGIYLEQLSALPVINALLSGSNSIWPFTYERLCSIRINIISKVHKFLTAAGKRYCFLPKESIKKELESGTLIKIPVLDIELPTKLSYIIYKKDLLELSYFNEFLDIIKQHIVY